MQTIECIRWRLLDRGIASKEKTSSPLQVSNQLQPTPPTSSKILKYARETNRPSFQDTRAGFPVVPVFFGATRTPSTSPFTSP